MTPEEESKTLLRAEFERLEAHAGLYDLELRFEETDDYAVIWARYQKPEGRTFVYRLVGDDYPRVAPLLRFVDPEAWQDPDRAAATDAEYWPGGNNMADRNKAHLVPCIRGHREFYEGGWHPGWQVPPLEAHRPYHLVVNVRNALHDVWT